MRCAPSEIRTIPRLGKQCILQGWFEEDADTKEESGLKERFRRCRNPATKQCKPWCKDHYLKPNDDPDNDPNQKKNKDKDYKSGRKGSKKDGGHGSGQGSSINPTPPSQVLGLP